MTIAKSLWHINSQESVILESPLIPVPNQVQLQTIYSLISPGTERTVALGQVPPALFEKMQVPYMGGGFEFPVKYGYSVVARSNDGRNFHLMHPHQDYLSVDPESIVEIPPDLDLWKAGLISNLETALTAFWDADPRPDEAILLVGFGWIGYLIAGVLKLQGCLDITVAEPITSRALLAKQRGFQVLGAAREYDVAIHCSATAEGLQICLDNMKWEGRVVEVSWYGNRMTPIYLGGDFHYKRLSIQSSQVSQIPGKMKEEWDYKKRKTEVIRLLHDAYWDQLEIPVLPFSQSPQIFDQIRRNEPGSLTYLLKY